jgi:hypothetical protein
MFWPDKDTLLDQNMGLRVSAEDPDKGEKADTVLVAGSISVRLWWCKAVVE